MDYQKKYMEWLNKACFDEATKEELRSIGDNEEEIRDRFYTELEFGTAGLRGVIGAGLNRMNYYTVGRATQGLADYINAQGFADMGVAIAYDSRHMSQEFADASARILAANGIRAYIFEDLRPTPELSFAVRQLNCTAGINITASHNPPEYNGYKVYWADGAQITPPHDSGITACVTAIKDFSLIRSMEREEAIAAGLYQVIGKEIDDMYVAAVKMQVKHPEAIEAEGKNLKIVYTPLHGTGLMPVTRVLSELGFENVYVVPEQEKPDGDFPTVSYPNPEDKKAFALALELAEEKDADLILATDPDADRLGVYVKDSEGNYQVLTGNMSGCLLAEYTISQIKEQRGLPEGGALIKSIVSSHMADAIADYYHVDLIETLTGFKYIGGEILRMEHERKGTYLFGFEESYGCLIGTYARDKDAVVATMALCEAAAFYRQQGRTLWDVMLEMYERYGYYREAVTSVTMKGADGIAKISEIMDRLRKDLPKSIGGKTVLRIRDYQQDTDSDLLTGVTMPTGLPKSNVLIFDFMNGEWLCVRPSGTEPKIKLYIGVTAGSLEESEKKAEEFMKEAEKLLEDPAENSDEGASADNMPADPYVYGPVDGTGQPRYRFSVPSHLRTIDVSAPGQSYRESRNVTDGLTAIFRVFFDPAKVVAERIHSRSVFFPILVLFGMIFSRLINSLVAMGLYSLRGYPVKLAELLLLLPKTVLAVTGWCFTLTFLFWLFIRLFCKKNAGFRQSFIAASLFLVPYIPYYFLGTAILPFTGTVSSLISASLSVAASVYFSVFGFFAIENILGSKKKVIGILALAAALANVVGRLLTMI